MEWIKLNLFQVYEVGFINKRDNNDYPTRNTKDFFPLWNFEPFFVPRVELMQILYLID